MTDQHIPGAPQAQAVRQHLVIAGTGRAGTSFLVRYLTALGLDTTLSRRGEAGGWDEAANAGLEELLVSSAGAHLPYVVKSPWIGEYFDEILADPAIRIDALIVPLRDLVEAATSRTVLEMRAIHQKAPWMAELDRSWEVWGGTAGGVVYSLNPLDQARLLGVAFHNLVWRAVEAGIPVHLLAFPRMVEDSGYLYETLRPVLPQGITAAAADEAHRRTADPGKVRVGGEVSEPDAAPVVHRAAHYPRPEQIDAIALRRELARLRAEAARPPPEPTELHGALQRAADETAALREALAAETARNAALSHDLTAITHSRIWRASGPLRAALTALRRPTQ